MEDMQISEDERNSKQVNIIVGENGSLWISAFDREQWIAYNIKNGSINDYKLPEKAGWTLMLWPWGCHWRSF